MKHSHTPLCICNPVFPLDPTVHSRRELASTFYVSQTACHRQRPAATAAPSKAPPERAASSADSLPAGAGRTGGPQHTDAPATPPPPPRPTLPARPSSPPRQPHTPAAPAIRDAGGVNVPLLEWECCDTVGDIMFTRTHRLVSVGGSEQLCPTRLEQQPSKGHLSRMHGMPSSQTCWHLSFPFHADPLMQPFGVHLIELCREQASRRGDVWLAVADRVSPRRRSDGQLD